MVVPRVSEEEKKCEFDSIAPIDACLLARVSKSVNNKTCCKNNGDVF